jgi:hypothetical protein
VPGVIRQPKPKLNSEQKTENMFVGRHMRQCNVVRSFISLCLVVSAVLEVELLAYFALLF